ncbi:hypothetical protein DNTS_009575 [Danionella cerebrum]|uniref:Uncharacterized protein n=1 Tax=Danionella cerebrum TaxID=2873325 RepID=A0A553NMV4_9TELE|nr:hypothetical protein DNTS_009575 [Danionella translucida]
MAPEAVSRNSGEASYDITNDIIEAPAEQHETGLSKRDSKQEQALAQKDRHPELELQLLDRQETEMATYMDMSFPSSIKTPHVQQARWVLSSLERKCGSSLEKLRCALGEYLQNGIQPSDLLERAVSFITLRRVLLSHEGYSRYSKELLRLFPEHTEDVAALLSEE